MITLVPVTPRNASIFRAIRLRALQDAPTAFGSTYAREIQLTENDWIKRSERWNGQTGAGFLAIEGEMGCGMVCSSLDEHDATRAHLIGMWTAPTHRRRGLGQQLVNEVLAWAASRSARTMQLLVTSNNVTAIRFYQGMGFASTGRTEPYPNNPDLIELEMSRSVPPTGSV